MVKRRLRMVEGERVCGGVFLKRANGVGTKVNSSEGGVRRGTTGERVFFGSSMII
jgi:hypothetical protein